MKKALTVFEIFNVDPPPEVYFVYKNKRFSHTIPSLPLTKYAVYYNPEYDLLGLDMGDVVRVYFEHGCRTYIPKTKQWTRIGVL